MITNQDQKKVAFKNRKKIEKQLIELEIDYEATIKILKIENNTKLIESKKKRFETKRKILEEKLKVYEKINFDIYKAEKLKREIEEQEIFVKHKEDFDKMPEGMIIKMILKTIANMEKSGGRHFISVKKVFDEIQEQDSRFESFGMFIGYLKKIQEIYPPAVWFYDENAMISVRNRDRIIKEF